MSKKYEFPSLSADPFRKIVDRGFPLHRFKLGSRHPKLFQEADIFPRTSDFKPTPLPMISSVKHTVFDMRRDAMEFNDYKSILLDTQIQDMKDNRVFEKYDPLKGNSLVVTDYVDNSELYIFSAGLSLSKLILMTSIKSTHYQTDKHDVKLALDQMHIQHVQDLQYPIRQITLSPLSTPTLIIFAVRTTCSIIVFKFTETIEKIHAFDIKNSTVIHPEIDNSMPTHVELSPFYKYQYAFTTNNGYTALVDGLNDSILFENVDPVPNDANYISRWRSCGFGRSPTTIYTAAPECVKEFVIRDQEIQVKLLSAPNDRIVAFAALNPMYCFVTIHSVIVMDRYRQEQPIVTWQHRMRDAVPTHIKIQKLTDNDWSVVVFSAYSQRMSLIQFHYLDTPIQASALKVEVHELYQVNLSPLKFEEIYQYNSRIGAVGFDIRTNTPNHPVTGNTFSSITRLFEDGSMRVQYLALEIEPSKEITTMSPSPKYELVPHQQLDEIMHTLDQHTCPEIYHNAKNKTRHAEVCDMDMQPYAAYIKKIKAGTDILNENTKVEIADIVRDLKSTTTYLHLFNNDLYQKYTLEALTDFLEEMEVLENIERARQIDIPGVFQLGKPTNERLHQNLKAAHEKLIQLSSLMIRPLRDTTDKFQYLNCDFHSTTTTKVFADLWTIDDTRFDDIAYPVLDSNRTLPTEKFPCTNIYKRERGSISEEMPFTLSQPVEPIHDEEELFISKSLAVASSSSQPTSAKHHSQFHATATQPLPGAFGSRTKPVKKKKKTAKTSGFK